MNEYLKKKIEPSILYGDFFRADSRYTYMATTQMLISKLTIQID